MRAVLRFVFFHFYHSFAWTYDLVAAVVSLGRWQAWELAAVPHLLGRRILELGFGPGHLQVELHQQGFLALGLDESQQMIRQAVGNLARNRFQPRLTRGLAQTMPFAAESFDSVLAVFPTEYIIDAKTLGEIRRVLRAGGRLVVVPMAWPTGTTWPERLADGLFRITGQREDFTEDYSERISAGFRAAGFRVDLRLERQPRSVAMVVVAEKFCVCESE